MKPHFCLRLLSLLLSVMVGTVLYGCGPLPGIMTVDSIEALDASLILTGDDFPLMAYRAHEGSDGFKVASWNPWTFGWEYEEVEPGQYAYPPSLAMAPGGTPSVAFVWQSPDEYCGKMLTRVNGEWTEERFYPDIPEHLDLERVALAYSPAGVPHIAFIAWNSETESWELWLAKREFNDWDRELVTSYPYPLPDPHDIVLRQFDVSIALDSQARPRIVASWGWEANPFDYVYRYDSRLIYAAWDGSAWQVEEFLTPPQYEATLGGSIAVDSVDASHLITCGHNNGHNGQGDGNVIYWENTSGPWDGEILWYAAPLGGYAECGGCDIAIRGGGAPRVVYSVYDGSEPKFVSAVKTPSGWTEETILEEKIYSPSLAVTQSGQAAVGYVGDHHMGVDFYKGP